ncbi:hypothetical protein [Vibrio sp. SCSIO 43137]|uniref:hypothetical protein n=1 Tax=Vibrio sp. SCSIO 43137 TaxID=3021011 RepID=UPI0023081BBF|nr:hypothetical protein [Vibrio sp. SCSIO 43137]WCE31120.1 hypothetical protein PK654_07600 [Vibrio sp. SCSIO 43137]
MKKCFENYALFIDMHRSYFNEVLAKEAGITWDTDSWKFNKQAKGFLTYSGSVSATFSEINLNLLKNTYHETEYIDGRAIKINEKYRDFIKAYLVSVIKQSSKCPSGSTLVPLQLLLKRIYVRMLFNKTEPHPVNITSDVIQDAVDLLARSRKRQDNAGDDYTLMNSIVNRINYYAFTQSSLELNKKIKRSSGKSTASAGKAKDRAFKEKHFAEDFGDDSDEKNLQIHAFLNVVALRSLVETPYEQVILNLVMFLMVTGMRYHEASTLKYNSFKIVEIEDEAIKRMLIKRGLSTFYLGIYYQGEKGAGQRTHWIEPLAIPLVEEIFVDTITKTEKLRAQTEFIRAENFKTFLPKELGIPFNEDSVTQRVPRLIDLDEIVEHIYESLSKSGQGKSRSPRSQKRDYARKRLKRLAIEPVREVIVSNGKQVYYNIQDINDFLHFSLKQDKAIADDLILNINDTKNNFQYTANYEDLLFLIPQGSASLIRTGVTKPIPQYIEYSDMNKFLGGGKKKNSSAFAKYNLNDEAGNVTQLTTHIPRHNINTFLAIAEVSEHLQAMMMGRVDIEQNKSYQHLAIQEKALSTNLVLSSKARQHVDSHNNALDTIKEKALIGINPNLSLGNAFAQNTQTFTTRKDQASFISEVLDATDSGLFSEFKEMFGDLVEPEEKKDLLHTHADLAPVSIGSCMRKLTTFQCPYNTKCQDGTPCPYFTLTGRIDESNKIEALVNSIESEITMINQMELMGELSLEEAYEVLIDLELRKKNILYLMEESAKIESEKIQINLLELDALQKPKTLSSLFALEHRNMKKLATQETSFKPNSAN